MFRVLPTLDEQTVPDTFGLVDTFCHVELKVKQYPDKTFVGRISRGFEFLGYAITTPGIVGVAKKTLERFVERVTRLYE